MRLEEEEEEAEDRTLLMLMRELSVSVINIGGPTAKRWRFLALFISVFFSLWVPTRDAVTDVIFEESKAEENLRREERFSSRHSSGLSCY